MGCGNIAVNSYINAMWQPGFIGITTTASIVFVIKKFEMLFFSEQTFQRCSVKLKVSDGKI